VRNPNNSSNNNVLFLLPNKPKLIDSYPSPSDGSRYYSRC
jgi:hypothetical protein